MKSYRLYFIFLMVAISLSTVNGQNDELSLIEEFELDADDFVGIDKFDNLYYTNNNTLFKKTNTDKIIAFKDILLGDIDRVDILNPNKLTVFYKLSNTVIVLDNRMTEIDRQDFNTLLPFKNVGFAGTSKDQGLWIYNVDLNQVELYDYRYDKTIAQSLPIDEEIISMKNNFNFCFLETTDGILIFNIYGSFIKNIKITNIRSFDLYKNRLIVHSANTIVDYDENFEPLNRLKFVAEDYKNFFYKDENLYLYDGKNISRYSIINKN